MKQLLIGLCLGAALGGGLVKALSEPVATPQGAVAATQHSSEAPHTAVATLPYASAAAGQPFLGSFVGGSRPMAPGISGGKLGSYGDASLVDGTGHFLVRGALSHGVAKTQGQAALDH